MNRLATAMGSHQHTLRYRWFGLHTPAPVQAVAGGGSVHPPAQADTPHTLRSGLAGVGDLMLTCYGKLSRNRSVGYRLGKGETMEDILASVSEASPCLLPPVRG